MHVHTHVLGIMLFIQYKRYVISLTLTRLINLPMTHNFLQF